MTIVIPEVILEAAEITDLEQIRGIEDRSFPFPWTDGMILMELFDNPFSISYVAKETVNHCVIGYVFMRTIIDELHLLNIAVHPEWRGNGVGEELLQRVLQVGQERRMEKVILEVRPSNHPAQSLYQKYRFHQVGRRKNYYLKPTEDAILLQYDFHSKHKASTGMPDALKYVHSS